MKRRVKLGILTVLLALGLTPGCGSSAGPAMRPAEGEIRVYYVNTGGTAPMSTGYVPENQGDAGILELFNVLQNGQFADGVPAVPQGVSLARSAWQEHSLVLYLEGDYPAPYSREEILCRYALVSSMLQMEDVEAVTVYVNGSAMLDENGNEIGAMTGDSFLSDVSAAAAEEEPVRVILYYANANGTKLVPCEVILTANGTVSLEKQVVETLIAGPAAENCFASIPSTTRVLGVNVHNRICYVNLDSGFEEESLGVGSFIRVYSLVNSLTALDSVDSVQLMINGAADFAYSADISFASPLAPDLTYVMSS